MDSSDNTLPDMDVNNKNPAETFFKENGYLEENATQDLSYQLIKLEIANEIKRIELEIENKELEILKMKSYLSGLQHQDRLIMRFLP